VQVNLFEDAVQASCLETQRSTTVIISFLNGAPVIWYSKRQNTVELSTFGSEFCIAEDCVRNEQGVEVQALHDGNRY
jgi:hypothetical protein